MRIAKIICLGLAAITGVLAGTTQAPQNKHFIWSLEGPEGSGFLMGSIHLLKKEYFPLPGVIRDAFAASGALAVEADISADKLAESALMQMRRGMFEEGDSLKNHVSPETYDLAARKLKDLGMDIAGFSRFKPWLLALTIASMEMMRLGFDPRWGVDRHFLDTAPADMEIYELEGLDFQMQLFDGFSDTMNDRFLFYNIQESENTRQQVDGMVSAWSRGDGAAMETLFTRSIKEHPELADIYELIVYQRNDSMTRRILKLLSPQRKLFVVVGAAHLVGEKGIVAQLQRRGYRLRQL